MSKVQREEEQKWQEVKQTQERREKEDDLLAY